jgi:predicted DNA-binding transcriptional regulator AlpA
VTPASDLTALLEGDLEMLAALPAERLPALLTEVAAHHLRLAAISNALSARLIAGSAITAARVSSGPEISPDTVDVREAARLLHMSPSWIYRQAKKLPFAHRVGGRALRFSRAGIEKYLATRRP